MGKIIEIQHLCKSYREIEAVKDISFTVNKGDFFAFLGENGAGKSTTINIITTLLKKSSGDVCVGGKYVDSEDEAIRQDLGVVFQASILDKHMTVRENITNRGKMYLLPDTEIELRLNALSEKIGLMGFLDRRYGQLSGGQKRRADIARALINRPKLLILDEPTTGLDPKTRQDVWQVIKQLNEDMGLTIFLTTHYMEEAAKADYIVIIDAGKIKAEGTPEALRRKFSSDRLIIRTRNTVQSTSKLEDMGYEYKHQKEFIVVLVENSFEAINIILAMKSAIRDFEIIRGNMDDVFINVLSAEEQEEGVN